MQNKQILTQINACNKYICQYIVKVDEQNWIIVTSSSHKCDSLQSNSKITSSKQIKQDKLSKKRFYKHSKFDKNATDKVIILCRKH